MKSTKKIDKGQGRSIFLAEHTGWIKGGFAIITVNHNV